MPEPHLYSGYSDAQHVALDSFYSSYHLLGHPQTPQTSGPGFLLSQVLPAYSHANKDLSKQITTVQVNTSN